MKNSTVLSKLVITNWGNSKKSHECISFSDISTLFTGDNGGGKTTVLDALAVVLYGSASYKNFNIGKKTKSKEKKRTATTYLKGARKDLPPIREDMDFMANIVAEFHDLKTNEYYCGGVVFQVPKDETNDIPEQLKFFTINGKIPDDEFVNYTFNDLEKLVNQRVEEFALSNPKVCKIYSSNTGYINVLTDSIFGGIDLETFIKLQKSAIAATIPENSTVEYFIREFLFACSENNVCESLIEKAKDIKSMEKLYQAKKDMLIKLKHICDKIGYAENLKNKTEEHRLITKYILYLVLTSQLSVINDNLEAAELSRKQLSTELFDLDNKYDAIKESISSTKLSIDNSEYGVKKELLKSKKLVRENIRRDEDEWQEILDKIRKWTLDSDLPVPQSVLSIYDQLKVADIKVEYFDKLKKVLYEVHNEIEEEYQITRDKKKQITEQIRVANEELDSLVNDNRLYRNKNVTSVARTLQERLSLLYTNKVEVRIFSRTFNIIDEEWRNAIESRLAAKSFLIVDPKFYDTAHEEFKKLKTFGVHLIDSKKMVEKDSIPKEGSLYECVHSDEDYIDAALRYYLGNIIRCDNISDFKNHNIENGILRDCFTYTQRSSFQPNEEDYIKYASIGLKVPAKVINQHKETINKLNIDKEQIDREYNRLLQAKELDYFNTQSSQKLYDIGLSASTVTLLEMEIKNLEDEISALKNGNIKELEEKLERLLAEQEHMGQTLTSLKEQISSLGTTIEREKVRKENQESELSRLTVVDDDIIVGKAEEWYKENWKKNASTEWVIDIRNAEIAQSVEQLKKAQDELVVAKSSFLKENASYGFDFEWSSNGQFREILSREELLFHEDTLKGYNEAYENAITDLQNHVIDQLNRDIKNARNHQLRINAQMQQHIFGNNYYKLEITKTTSSYGMYYDMLTSPNLDFKIQQNDDGQMDLYSYQDGEYGSDSLLHGTYSKEITSFINQFIPPELEDYNNDTLLYEDAQKKFKERLKVLTDYRTYLKFDLKAYVDTSRLSDSAKKNLLDSVSVDRTAGADSGGEEVSPKYIAILMGFKMLYESSQDRKSKFSLVMMDESFDKLDSKRTKELLSYAKELDLQLIVSVPDKEGRVMKDWLNRTVYFVQAQDEYSMIQQFEKKEIVSNG